MACPSQTSLTDADLKAPYAGTNPLLPATSADAMDRDDTHMMTRGAVQQIVQQLQASGVVPNPKTVAPEAYAAKQAAFLAAAQTEYCFYEARYKYALQQLFSAIRNSYQQTTPASQASVNKYLADTQTFNLHLNDLIQILTALTTQMMSVNESMNTEIQTYQEQLQSQQARLQEQKRILRSNEAAMKLNKQMVRYTEEKSRYTDNLMKLYGVLNVVVLGLLVYVYRAGKE